MKESGKYGEDAHDARSLCDDNRNKILLVVLCIYMEMWLVSDDRLVLCLLLFFRFFFLFLLFFFAFFNIMQNILHPLGERESGSYSGTRQRNR